MRAIAHARLRWELAWTHILLWIASTASRREANPETHLYLADLHYRLAAEYEAAGRPLAARRHRNLANAHSIQGPPPSNPPRAAAMAMPIPPPPIFTDARGVMVDTPSPDDVA